MTDLERPTLHIARVALWKDRNKEELLVGRRPSGEAGNRLPRSKNYPGLYEFTGGKFTPPNDPSLEALRELKEETNLHCVRLFPPNQPLHHTYVMEEKTSPHYGKLISTHFIEAVAIHAHKIFEEPPEHDLLAWMTLDEIEKLDLIPQSFFALAYLREQQNLARAINTKMNR